MAEYLKITSRCSIDAMTLCTLSLETLPAHFGQNCSTFLFSHMHGQTMLREAY